MSGDAGCSVAYVAEYLDLDERRVQQLANEGVAVRLDRGLYDLKASVRGYIQYLRAKLPAPGKMVLDYAAERARLIAAKANLAELEEAERRGELISSGDAEDAVFDLGRRAQEALFAIPDRLASILAAETEAAKVHKLMEMEIAGVCERIASFALPSGAGANNSQPEAENEDSD